MKHPLYPMGVTLFFLAGMLAAHFLLPLATLIPAPWTLLGLIPMGLGIAVNLAADASFRKAGTTVKPFEDSSSLVTHGMYCISRNPMYLGFALILAGVAALLGSLSPWLGLPTFILVTERMYITTEERMLAARFGAEWVAYANKVRRWI